MVVQHLRTPTKTQTEKSTSSETIEKHSATVQYILNRCQDVYGGLSLKNISISGTSAYLFFDKEKGLPSNEFGTVYKSIDVSSLFNKNKLNSQNSGKVMEKLHNLDGEIAVFLYEKDPAGFRRIAVFLERGSSQKILLIQGHPEQYILDHKLSSSYTQNYLVYNPETRACGYQDLPPDGG